MAKEEDKKEEKTVKFLDKEVTQTVRPKDGAIIIKMKKGEYLDLLDKKGLSAEVLKTCANGLQEVCSEAIMAAKDICKKNKGAKVEITLGQGDFSQEIKFIGRKEINGHNPITKEEIHRTDYGVVSATLNLPYGKKMKGEDGELAKISEEMKDFFSKMKK